MTTLTLSRIFFAAALLLALSCISLGHHSIKGTYDAGKASTITGVITEVIWTNPHVWIYMNVKDAKGKTETWHIEVGAPNALFRDGIRKEEFKLNDSYSVDIWPAFTETSKGFKTAAGRKITLPSGRQVDIHDIWGDSMPFPTSPSTTTPTTGK